MRDVYLDFIEEPEGTQRRTEKERGIYQDYLIETIDGTKIVFILLDVRFHYRGTSDYERLGTEQWAWLEETLLKHKNSSDLILIGSGVQIIPFKFMTVYDENW